MGSFIGAFISGFLLAVIASLLFQTPPCNWQRFFITLAYYIPFLLLFILRMGVNSPRLVGFLFYSSGTLLGLHAGSRLVLRVNTKRGRTPYSQELPEYNPPSQEKPPSRNPKLK